ncbi:MAG: putative CRISPR-associated protein [Crocosphaera sp.]
MNQKKRPLLIISTVGTSLLTNQINRETERHWFAQLSNYANEKIESLPSDVKDILEILKNRALTQLNQGNVSQVRRASAELNGIYGIYDNNINQGKQDLHYLISTDTAQGKITAEIVKFYLLEQGLSVNIFAPVGLSTANTSVFSDGIDQLIIWLREKIVIPYQNHYKIYFNLVGGFKSLQGYLNTLAMFYADAIAYIFEGKNAELITIPRLPITIDRSLIEAYKLPLALMKAVTEVKKPMEIKVNDYPDIPEALVYIVDDEMTLSTWGKLVWEECKNEILLRDLLEFPRLVYLDSFREDYKKNKDVSQRVNLQETLAKVSVLLEKSQGNTAILRSNNAGGILYDSYTGKQSHLDHFRLNDDWRISCFPQKGKLYLRHFGKHDYVNKNP